MADDEAPHLAALYRLERQGLIQSDWKVTENNRRARFYTLTAAGRKQLGAEISSFDQVLLAINRVMRRGDFVFFGPFRVRAFVWVR